jgi:hypothetical protein
VDVVAVLVGALDVGGVGVIVAAKLVVVPIRTVVERIDVERLVGVEVWIVKPPALLSVLEDATNVTEFVPVSVV